MPNLGRNNEFGLAKETTRLAGMTAPAIFLPYTSMEINSMNKYQDSNEAIGVRHAMTSRDVLNQSVEGKLDGLLNADTIGHFLLYSFGSVTSVQSGTTGAYTHTFTINNNVTLPTFSAFYERADVGWLRARGCSVEELDISAEASGDSKYIVSFKALQEDNMANQTPVYTDTKARILLGRNCTVKYASSISGLATGTALDTKKVSIKSKNNIHVDFALGSQFGVDVYGKQNEPEASFTAVLKSNVFDTNFKAGTKMAMSYEWQNVQGISLGSSTLKPLLRFEIAPSIVEVKTNTAINDLVSMDCTIKPEYSYPDSFAIRAILQNTTASY